MEHNIQHLQPSIVSYLHNKPKTKSYKKSGLNNKNDKPFVFPLSFRQQSKTYNESNECKLESEPNSKSPSPCTLMSSLDLTKQQRPPVFTYPKPTLHSTQNDRKSKKRKLSIHENTDHNSLSTNNSTSNNCLKKVVLSDGSVCYTMVAPSSSSCTSSSSMHEPPTKKLRSNSYGGASASSSSISLCEPPAKKRRPNSCINMTYNIKHKNHKNHDFTKIEYKEEKEVESDKDEDIGNRTPSCLQNKPKLIYSQTMPIPEKENKKKEENAAKKRRRRHSGDWTSRDNLLSSLKEQLEIQDKLFPSHQVPNVNLKEMFSGLKMIRVHKKLRPINMRRETQIFN